MIVNELVTAFSFKGNTNPLKDFNKELGGVIPKMKKFSMGMIGVASLFARLIADNPMVQFTNRTDESIKNIQALELASVKFGASLASSLETTRNLSKALADAKIKGNKAFGQFGLSIIDESGKLKKTQDILKDINKLFNSTNRVYGELADKRQKLIVLQTLGIKEDLLPLLIQTTEEYSKQIKISEQFSLSKDQAKSIREFNNSLNETKSTVSQITSLVSADFGKSFKGITDSANDFLKTNKEIVVTISDQVLKVSLVIGAVGSLMILVKGLAAAFTAMFLPVTAALLAIEAYEKGVFKKETYHDEGMLSVKSVRNFLGITDEDSRKLRKQRGIADPPFKIHGSVSGERVQKIINQTNTFNVTTDNPKVMSDVIENSVNKGIKLIQETSTRGGI